MKTQIKILIPQFGHGQVDVEYRVNGVHDKTLYTFTGFWPLYRGQRGEQLDTQSVINMNGQSELEEIIVEKTQGSHRAGLEADAVNPRIQSTEKRKFKFKKPNTNLPD